MSGCKLHVFAIVAGFGLLACDKKTSLAPAPSSMISGVLATPSGAPAKVSGRVPESASSPSAASTIPLSESQINDLLGTIDPVMDLPAESPPASDAAADAGLASTSVLEILRGTGNAAALPVVAANPGRELDPTLRKRLTTITIEPGVGSGAFEVRMGTGAGQTGHRTRVLAGLRGRFRTCYQTALRSEATLSGNLVLSVRVQRNGEVATANAEKRTGLNEGVQACVIRVLRNAQFDESEKDETMMVPLTFVAPRNGK
jgi:hypothetical protein